jgi:hypothetical protein
VGADHSIDEVGRDSYSVPRSTNNALQHITNPEFTTDLAEVDRCRLPGDEQ